MVPTDPVLNADMEASVNDKGETVYNGSIDEYKQYFSFVNELLAPTRDANVNKKQHLTGKTRVNLAQYSGSTYKKVYTGKVQANTWKNFDNIGNNQFQYPRVVVKKRGGEPTIVIPKVNYPAIVASFSENSYKKESSNSFTSVVMFLINTPPEMDAFLDEDNHEAI